MNPSGLHPDYRFELTKGVVRRGRLWVPATPLRVPSEPRLAVFGEFGSLFSELVAVRQLERRRIRVAPRIRDLISTDLSHALVMDRICGQTLSEQLREHQREGQRLPLRNWLLGISVLAAKLAQVHRAGLVHTAIHPDVVTIESPFKLWIFEFQDAVAIGKEPRRAGRSGYESAEQIARRPLSSKSDIAGLGMTLLQGLVDVGAESMATRGRSGGPRFRLVLREDTPPRLVELVERMLSEDPDRRPSAELVHRELQRTVCSLPPYVSLRDAQSEASGQRIVAGRTTLRPEGELLNVNNGVPFRTVKAAWDPSVSEPAANDQPPQRTNAIQDPEATPTDRDASRVSPKSAPVGAEAMADRTWEALDADLVVLPVNATERPPVSPRRFWTSAMIAFAVAVLLLAATIARRSEPIPDTPPLGPGPVVGPEPAQERSKLAPRREDEDDGASSKTTPKTPGEPKNMPKAVSGSQRRVRGAPPLTHDAVRKALDRLPPLGKVESSASEPVTAIDTSDPSASPNDHEQPMKPSGEISLGNRTSRPR
jgi:hypothetical protein